MKPYSGSQMNDLVYSTQYQKEKDCQRFQREDFIDPKGKLYTDPKPIY